MAYLHDYKIRHKDYTMEALESRIEKAAGRIERIIEPEFKRYGRKRFWQGVGIGIAGTIGMILATGCSTTQQAVKEKPFYWERTQTETRLYMDRMEEEGYIEKHLGDTYMIKEQYHRVNPPPQPKQEEKQPIYEIHSQ